jgi:hypothetical protein
VLFRLRKPIGRVLPTLTAIAALGDVAFRLRPTVPAFAICKPPQNIRTRVQISMSINTVPHGSAQDATCLDRR